MLSPINQMHTTNQTNLTSPIDNGQAGHFWRKLITLYFNDLHDILFKCLQKVSIGINLEDRHRKENIFSY